MDPIATILCYLVGNKYEKRSHRLDLAQWIRRGGFRPSIEDIASRARGIGQDLPPRWRATCLRLGATL